MADVLVLVEHRQRALRDVTLELFGAAQRLFPGAVVGVVLGGDEALVAAAARYADRIIALDHPALADFNSASYHAALEPLLRQRAPALVLGAQSSFSVDLVPGLAAALGWPLLTDCTEVAFADGRLRVGRQLYGGKVNARLRAARPGPAIALLRAGVEAAAAPRPAPGAIERVAADLPVPTGKRFLGYVEAEVSDVDIAQADRIVAVGRGIREEKHMPMVKELADLLGGVLACSRPVIDAGWLPKDRQVGSSGKTVKPRLYLAFGISGAFQHVTGMKGAELVVAVNKDPEAPIFGFAHFGVVGDLFKIIPALTARLKEAHRT